MGQQFCNRKWSSGQNGQCTRGGLALEREGGGGGCVSEYGERGRYMYTSAIDKMEGDGLRERGCLQSH